MGILKKALSVLLLSVGALSLVSCDNEAKPTESAKPSESETTKPTEAPETTPSVEESIKDRFECISIAKANQIATEHGQSYGEERFFIYGKIKEIVKEEYGNMTITDGTNEIFVYGVYSIDGKTKFGQLEDKPGVGDELVISALLGQFNGKNQAKSGWLQAYKKVGADAVYPTAPDTTTPSTKPSETEKPTDTPIVTPEGEVALTVDFNEVEPTEKIDYCNDQTKTFGGKEFFFSGFYQQPVQSYGPACVRLGGKHPVELTNLGLSYKGYYLEASFDTEAVKGISLTAVKSYKKYDGWEVLFKEAGSEAYTSVATGTGLNISASLAEAKNGRFVVVVKGAEPRLDLGVYKLYK